MRPANDPLGVVKGRNDVISIGIRQCTHARNPYSPVYELGDGRSQLCFGLRKNDGAFYEILQFPDVAWPVVSDQGLYHIVRDPLD